MDNHTASPGAEILSLIKEFELSSMIQLTSMYSHHEFFFFFFSFSDRLLLTFPRKLPPSYLQSKAELFETAGDVFPVAWLEVNPLQHDFPCFTAHSHEVAPGGTTHSHLTLNLFITNTQWTLGRRKKKSNC